MSWRSRAVLAATAGVGLVGAGALTAAYAAGSDSLLATPTHVVVAGLGLAAIAGRPRRSTRSWSG